jgi:hypothetical protein
MGGLRTNLTEVRRMARVAANFDWLAAGQVNFESHPTAQ